jgi:tetratricopeptide (TPR) repeat protein
MFREAVEHMERAVERDPMPGLWRAILGSHLTHVGSFDRAAKQAHTALKLDPTSFHAHTILGEIEVMQGRWSESLEPLERAHRIYPNLAFNTGFLAAALARTGDRPRAERLIASMGDTPRTYLGRALYHVILDELDDGAAWYERALEHRDPFALVFPQTLLRPLRQTAHWERIARTMNLPRER